MPGNIQVMKKSEMKERSMEMWLSLAFSCDWKYNDENCEERNFPYDYFV